MPVVALVSGNILVSESFHLGMDLAKMHVPTQGTDLPMDIPASTKALLNVAFQPRNENRCQQKVAPGSTKSSQDVELSHTLCLRGLSWGIPIKD